MKGCNNRHLAVRDTEYWHVARQLKKGNERSEQISEKSTRSVCIFQVVCCLFVYEAKFIEWHGY